MARGSNTLFADIFETPTLPAKQKKGRNKDLHVLRNECLIDRYFYYGSQRLSYTAILETIGKEFFVSTYTIPYLIADHVQQLKKLKEEKPNPQHFKKKWPHLVW